jgi:hypothetical protein
MGGGMNWSFTPVFLSRLGEGRGVALSVATGISLPETTGAEVADTAGVALAETIGVEVAEMAGEGLGEATAIAAEVPSDETGCGVTVTAPDPLTLALGPGEASCAHDAPAHAQNIQAPIRQRTEFWNRIGYRKMKINLPRVMARHFGILGVIAPV